MDSTYSWRSSLTGVFKPHAHLAQLLHTMPKHNWPPSLQWLWGLFGVALLRYDRFISYERRQHLFQLCQGQGNVPCLSMVRSNRTTQSNWILWDKQVWAWQGLAIVSAPFGFVESAQKKSTWLFITCLIVHSSGVLKSENIRPIHNNNCTEICFIRPTLVAVKAMMCWTSLQVRQGRTCNMRATIPAARGAAADVPVWPSVQPVPSCMDQSEVTCRDRWVEWRE